MNSVVDLRSDTVTRPSDAMRQFMARAEVGDDVIGDDPTVQKLEETAARMLGKEAALFVPSGTMGNQLSIFTHTSRGNEVICGKPCHIQEHEVGAAAVLSAVTLVPVDAPTGRLDPDAVAKEIRSPDIHHPETGLVCLECAHSSGAVPSIEEMTVVSEVAHQAGLPVHLDGARIFNAAQALDVDVSRIAAVADSVMFCLSKGLGAPVGSLLCGTEEFVSKARKGRKILGGGMRQAGILAAGGLYALEHNVDRLVEDHRRARRLAEGLADIPGVTVFEDRLDINLVWFSSDSNKAAERLVSELEERSVLVYPPMHGQWRLVTHLDIDDGQVDHAIEQFRAVFS